MATAPASSRPDEENRTMLLLSAGFVVFVMVMMMIDLRFVGRRGGGVSIPTALIWTGVCIALALAFVPCVYFIYEHHWLGMGLPPPVDPGAPVPIDHKPPTPTSGLTAATWFLQGWMLEYSLSVDNLFVFAVIFRHFKVPDKHQHRVLAWGIIAALVLRAAMIVIGVALIERFHWLLYIAAAFLLYTAWKMVSGKHEEYSPEKSLVLRIARRFVPVTNTFHGDRFFVRRPDGAGGGTGGRKWSATPMFLVLVVLNLVDILFALDSIPAIIGITTDSFIVFTSNVFALLGLRSLYFVLAGMMNKFKYLSVSLAVILAFVGVKMLIQHPITAIGFGGVHISPVLSLGVISASLLAGALMSIHANRKAAALAPKDGPYHPPEETHNP